MWYQYHEAPIDENGRMKDGFHDRTIRLGYDKEAKEKGNAVYQRLKTRDYVFYGKYEQDICSYETKIK